MFKSAVFKLTVWYVGALVVVCLLFSLPIYGIASSRLRSGAERQTDYVRQLPGQFNAGRILPQLEVLRERQLDKDRQELLVSLLFINVSIIGLGAYASYLFARRTLRPIEQAHAAQAAFTANASHELRTPLAVMQTEIDVALRNNRLSSAEARQVLASSLEEVARLRQLSDQLLGLTRTEGALKLKAIKLDQVLADEIKKLSARHKITITKELTKNTTIKGDALLLRQVLGILVDNAVTYADTPDPGVRVSLVKNQATTSDAVGGTVVLQVSDQGKGIKPSELPHIFDRFYRGSEATKAKSSGHGLGLSLAQDIVQRHKGEILASSKAGKGTTFAITLPVNN